jgi:lantibiotic modifying enzyme
MTLEQLQNQDHLETAAAIGRRIVAKAIWHEDRCTWIGALAEQGADGQPTLTFQTLGADLYGGTAGVAMFLAELHSATGEPEVREVAIAAMNHALAREPALAPAMTLGLYAGRVGISLAAARVGILLGVDRYLDSSLRIITDMKPNGDEFDLIAGRAGAIVGLITLSTLLDRQDLIDTAAQLGTELLDLADRRDDGWSWQAPGRRNAHNLTGFSHGTAGAGYALVDLGVASREATFLQAAERAFDYERHAYDRSALNWPDFRRPIRKRQRNPPEPAFANFWCHGAPGIALSRLRAYSLQPTAVLAEEARIALQTTRQMLQAFLESGTGNLSLCHGLAGNSETLLYGQQVLGGENDEDLALVGAVADSCATRFNRPGVEWPCGTLGGETPNLMLGLAGIGLFYLRLHTPTVCSAVLPSQTGPAPGCILGLDFSRPTL